MSERSYKTKQLSDVMRKVIKPIMTKNGISHFELLENWSDIVGSDIASSTRPIKVSGMNYKKPTQKTQKNPTKTLHLLVKQAFALDIQYYIPQIIERVNQYYGYPFIHTIFIKQGYETEETLKKIKVKKEKNICPDQLNKIDHAVSKVDNEGLSKALKRMGQSIILDQE